MKLSIELADGKRLSYDSCGDLLVIDAPRVEITGSVEPHVHSLDPFGPITAPPAPEFGKLDGVRDSMSMAAYVKLLSHAVTLRERIVNGADPETRKAVETAMQYVQSQEQLYMMPKGK